MLKNIKMSLMYTDEFTVQPEVYIFSYYFNYKPQ